MHLLQGTKLLTSQSTSVDSRMNSESERTPMEQNTGHPSFWIQLTNTGWGSKSSRTSPPM